MRRDELQAVLDKHLIAEAPTLLGLVQRMTYMLADGSSPEQRGRWLLEAEIAIARVQGLEVSQ